MRCHQAYTLFDLKHDSRIETRQDDTERALRKKEKFNTVMERIVMSPERTDTPEKPEVFQDLYETNSRHDRNPPAPENLEKPIETAKAESSEPLGFMIRNNPHIAGAIHEDAVPDKMNIVSQKAKMLTIEDQNGAQSVKNGPPADTMVDTKESLKIRDAIQQSPGKNMVDADNHVSRDTRERMSSLAEEIKASVRTAQVPTAQRVTGQDIALSRKGGSDAVQAMAQTMEPRQNTAELTNQVVDVNRLDRIVETSSLVSSDLGSDGSMKDRADRESGRVSMASRSGKFVMPAQLNGSQALTGGNTVETIQMREAVGTDSASTPFEQMLNRTERLQEVIDRFDEHMLALTSRKGNSMTINLIPPNLGKIVLNCRESGGEMFIEIVAQNRHVREFLSEHREFIREIVEDRGHKLAEFDVTTQDNEQRHGRFEREVTDGAQRTGRMVAAQVIPNQAAPHNNSWEYTPEDHDGLWLVA